MRVDLDRFQMVDSRLGAFSIYWLLVLSALVEKYNKHIVIEIQE